MTRTPLLAAAAAAALAVGGVALASTGGGDDEKASTSPPKIYGAAAPASPTSTPRPTEQVAEDLARRWAVAWDRVQVCRDQADALKTVVSLSTGKLAQQLTAQPPRVSYASKCDPKKVIATKTIATRADRYTVIVEREGETGGPLTLTLIPTDRGLRVVTIDY